MRELRRYPVSNVRVIDGDSVACDIDVGLDIEARDWHCRLLGVNTPELHAKDEAVREKAKAARDRLATLCSAGRCWIDATGECEKYGRLLVTLIVTGSILSANDVLLEEGLALPYSGGPRE